VYRIYALEYVDFITGNFNIDKDRIFYLDGIFIEVTDKTDEFIEFD